VENACVDVEAYDDKISKKRKLPTPSIMQCNRKNRLRDLISRKGNLQQRSRPLPTVEMVDFNQRYHEVYVHVHNILCSETWTQSHIAENEKNDCKMKVCVIKYIRMYKLTNVGMLPILPDMISHMSASFADSRCPVDPLDYTLSMRKTITKRCTDAICNHLYFLSNTCSARISKSKLQLLCVGLLYLLKKGISMHGVVILPKFSILNIILPPEG
jgi:hypothetical protein